MKRKVVILFAVGSLTGAAQAHISAECADEVSTVLTSAIVAASIMHDSIELAQRHAALGETGIGLDECAEFVLMMTTNAEAVGALAQASTAMIERIGDQ